MSAQYPFVIVDASGYLFRAYHALPKLTNSQGEPTGALIGVLNMLRKLLDEYQPKYVAIVFDLPGGTFRNRLFPDYKANRPPAPEDLKPQIPLLYETIEAMGLPLLTKEDYEADDIIGTLAKDAVQNNIPCLISTGDKDLAQLVEPGVTLINTMKDNILDTAGVEEQFGVRPGQIADYLALIGDVVDNIPGVEKCGPKTAVKWLQEYDNLDTIMANAEQINGKVGENLRRALPQLPLSRTLATIDRDVPLAVSIADLVPSKPDREKLFTLYRRFESKRLLSTLESTLAPELIKQPQIPTPTAIHYETVLTEEALDAWLEKVSHASLLAFDTETTSLDYMDAELVGVSLCCESGQAAYFPCGHQRAMAPEQLDRSLLLSKLKPLLESAQHLKVGQNLKYDMNILALYNIELRGIAHDTMLESYVLDSTATNHDMDSLAERYLNYKTIRFVDIAGKGVKQLTFDQIPLAQAAPYAAEDADITMRLHQALWPQLEQTTGQKAVYEELEIPLIRVLSNMERTGVLIDSPLLHTQSEDLARRMVVLEEQAFSVAGEKFNLGSPKQLGEILYNKLQLPITTKTPKGAPSTAESVLEGMAEDGFELPRIILDYRSLAKLRSTYTEKLPQMVNARTGRLHTSYHQAVASTGRLSSSNPNLQNIPIRTEDGRQIRRAFIAAPGFRIVAADYSQIELRIMAHLSGDERLLAAFAADMDIHRATAAEILGKVPEEVTDDERRSAKAVNFGLIYGMSAFGLAKQLSIGRKQAQDYVDRYFERYPGVKAFMEQTRLQAHTDGYVQTLRGRRLYLPTINSNNQNLRQAAERTAINAPMQGTAADIIKQAMISLQEQFAKQSDHIRMLMQVHDELVFEVAEDEVNTFIPIITTGMSEAACLRVPLQVSVGVGANWDEAH